MLKRAGWVVALVSAGVVSGSAWGQVVPPPGEKPEPAPDFERPNLSPTPTAPRTASRPRSMDLPDLGYEPLAQKAEDGTVKPLSKPADYAALDVNPTVGAKSRERIDAALIERRAMIEGVILEHPAVMRDIETGLIEELDINQKHSFDALREALLPVMGMKTLPEWLYEQGAMSVQQRNFNTKIAQEYHAEKMSDFSDEDGVTDFNGVIRYTVHAQCAEAVWIYEDMLIETSVQLHTLAPKAGIGQDVAGPTMAQISTASSREESLKMMRGFVQSLSVDDEQKLLRAMVDSRE